MPRSSRLTLIAPNVGIAPSAAQSSGTSENLPLLARIGTRGERARVWRAGTAEEARLESWQRALLRALKLDESTHPSAAISAIGAQLSNEAQEWWHATPIHLAAGLNEVALVPLERELALSDDDMESLKPTLASHLDEGQLRLHTIDRDWLIAANEYWQFESVTVRFASIHDWNAALPKGADAGRLRRLITELQMVLHDHRVNDLRAARGLPSANAVWIWGNGRISSNVQSAKSAFVVGARPFVRGLRVLHALDGADSANAESLVEKSSTQEMVVGVIETADMNQLESQWLTPLVAALKQGRFETLELIIDEWQITLSRSQLRRFWRRDQPVKEWLVQ